jgi:hypothetical protein
VTGELSFGRGGGAERGGDRVDGGGGGESWSSGKVQR